MLHMRSIVMWGKATMRVGRGVSISVHAKVCVFVSVCLCENAGLFVFALDMYMLVRVSWFIVQCWLKHLGCGGKCPDSEEGGSSF